MNQPAFRVCLIIALSIGWLSDSAIAQIAQGLAGQGRWQSLSGATMGGTWTADLTQSGTELSGSIALTGTTLFRDSGSVSGTVDGEYVLLALMSEGAEQVTFRGKRDGESVTGEWSFPAMNDRGTWRGTLRAKDGGS
jgi:hypothetical protein